VILIDADLIDRHFVINYCRVIAAALSNIVIGLLNMLQKSYEITRQKHMCIIIERFHLCAR